MTLTTVSTTVLYCDSLWKFWEATVKNKRCFLLTPMLSSSHYRPIENGFLGGVKKGELPPSEKNDPQGRNLPPKHVFGCIERQATLLMVSCRCVEVTKNKKIKKHAT